MDDLWVSAEKEETSIFIPPGCSAAFSPWTFKLCLAGAKQPRVMLRCGSATEIGAMRELTFAVIPLGSHSAPPGSRCKGMHREDLRSCQRAEKTQHCLLSTPHSRAAGTQITHGPEEDNERLGSSWMKLNPNSREKRVGESFSHNSVTFGLKQACTLQLSLLCPAWGTVCDMLATLLAGKQLLVAYFHHIRAIF